MVDPGKVAGAIRMMTRSHLPKIATLRHEQPFLYIREAAKSGVIIRAIGWELTESRGHSPFRQERAFFRERLGKIFPRLLLVLGLLALLMLLVPIMLVHGDPKSLWQQACPFGGLLP
jgi:hypothetical protein